MADQDNVDYGYGDDAAEYGYGDDTQDYGYGDGDGQDFGCKLQCNTFFVSIPGTNFGLLISSSIRRLADGDSADYGYGDSQEGGEKTEAAPAPAQKPGTRRRRNSVVIRKDDDPLAVADYLMGGDPNKKDGN
eukprot:scaffold1089_cov153-Amphora_coffeaeformis.AAC.2